MISFRSFKNFLLTNLFIFTGAILQSKYCAQGNIFFTLLVRNYALVYSIDYVTSHKKEISCKKKESNIENHLFLFSSTATETITYVFAKYMILPIEIKLMPSDIYYFIPISFLFEIILDLFHYLTHRMLHEIKCLYFIHKLHHKYAHPQAINTFYHNPLDLIITNMIPFLLTLFIFKKLNYNISFVMLNLLFMTKSYVEISGHTGKKLYPTGSFGQFIWLPRIFNIELYTENHDLHHSSSNCNYGKRFSIWDKLFTTYRSG